MTVIKRPRKAKVAGFMRAQNLINTKHWDIRRAIKEAGISATTYYKYLEMFGENVSDTQIEVLPIAGKVVPVSATPAVPKSSAAKFGADLDNILKENAALAEQIKLRVELSKLMH